MNDNMPAKTANHCELRRVVIVIYPGVTLLDVTGPAQVFWTAGEVVGAKFRYEIVLTASSGPLVSTDTGIALSAASLRKAASSPIDTLLVAGGLGVFEACSDATLCRWISRNARTARRAGSLCMGTFLLGAAGLILGRRVTTHWRWAEELRRRHPDSEILADSIFVRDRRLWTAAGVTTGIDMALAMIEEDSGRQVALEVARSLVVYLKRAGGQSQFSAMLSVQSADINTRFEELHHLIAADPTGDLSVERLAERMGMSPRNFARVYVKEVGVTPGRAIERFRLDAARRLLDDHGLSLEMVATRAGFGSQERMRRAFVRATGTTPTDYRRRFGA